MDLIKVEQIAQELQQDFETIAMAKSPYILENLIVKERDTEPEQWNQCVLEMRARYINIKRALLQIKRLRLEINNLTHDEFYELDRQDKELAIEEMEWALTGQYREFYALYSIYKSFGKRYTRQELDEAQADYWFKRLSRQATQDILANDRVSVGNQDALRQIGVSLNNDNGELLFIQHKRLK